MPLVSPRPTSDLEITTKGNLILHSIFVGLIVKEKRFSSSINILMSIGLIEHGNYGVKDFFQNVDWRHSCPGKFHVSTRCYPQYEATVFKRGGVWRARPASLVMYMSAAQVPRPPVGHGGA